MKINFILTGEGSSDLRLVEHIEGLLIQNGFDEASGEAPDLGRLVNTPGRTVREKLAAILEYYPDTDAIFVHRDADGEGADARQREIEGACEEIAGLPTVIPVIPVTMLETWLLADQNAIKMVAGNQNHKGNVSCIPSINKLESVRDTKSLLLEALCEASAAQGGRLAKFKKRFSDMRARLTYDLDPDGPVSQLPSYQSFRQRLQEFSQARIARS